MALTVQNLRAVGVGVEPASLLPGQIAFNITDKAIYVGDGSNFKTNFDGTQVAGVPGNGWYAMPMDFDSLGEYYVANPGYYGDVPTDGQVLTWSTALNHTIWSNGAGGGSQVYVVSNAAVAAAPGATTSAKITAAIGVVSPDEGNVTIVTGIPDDVYEGLYFFTTEWVKGAAYAYPSASEVIYDNTAHPSLSATVQGAIDDLDDGLAATTAIANTANSTANSALSIASAALPKAGGVMTGNITFGSAGTGVIFNDSSNIRSISDSATSVSSVTAGSSTAVKTAYDLAAAAVPRVSYTAPGDLVVGTGVGSFNALAVGTPGQILAVAPGGTSLTWVTDSEGDVTGVSGTLPITINNTNPQIPVVGVNLATTTSTGVVQVGSNIDLGVGGVISVKSSTTSQAGIVQLNNTLSSTSVTEALTANQGRALSAQISALTISGTTTLAGSINASTGLLQTVTTQGTAAGFAVNQPLPPPAPNPSPPGNNNYYVIVTAPGTFTPPSSPSITSENGDWILSNGTVWQELEVGARPSYASTITAGIVQLADNAATQAGTDGTLAVTPLGLQSKLSDSTSTTSSTRIASSTAVKSAYDLANAALPKTGGTMTGDITLSGVGVGIVFNDASTVEAISDSTATTSSITAASSTAVKSAYDLANAAVPQTGGTMTGDLTFSGAGVGVVFNDASTVEAISDSTATTSSVTAASSTAVKSAYDLANAALARSGGTMTGAITFVAGQTFPVSGIQDATTGQKGIVQVGANIDVSVGTISVATATSAVKGVVQVGTNIDVSSGTVSVKSSTTTQSGVVQLNDTLASTSTTQALTANMGRDLQVQINALATSNNLTFAGTIDGATGLMLTVTVEGAAAGFTVGNVMPSPSAAIKEYFTIISVAGTMTPPGGVPTQTYVGDWWLASSSTWTYIAAGFQPPYASTTTPGLVRLSTNAETQAGTDATEAVTPASLQSKVSDSVSTTSSIAIASSTAVKSAYDLANAAVPKACYTALGALAAGTGIGTVGTLPLGTNGQVLAANSATSTGLQWCTISLACVPCSAFTGSGVLLAGTGTSTFTALNVGSNGQFLTVDSTCTGGIKWVTANGANICGFTCALTPFNTSIGALAGAALTSLSVANTAIGYAALDTETVGDFNTAIGHNALTAQNGPTGNTAIGGNAGAQIVGGACNTLMGYNAGDALTTGGLNVALGFDSLGSSISGTNNVAVGASALALNASSGNTAIGFCSGASLALAPGNTFVGCGAGRLSTTGQTNTAIGCGAMGTGVTTGSNNFAGGVLAGDGLTSGSTNTFLGYTSGRLVTTGGQNTIVGAYGGTTTLANNVVLADGAGTIRFQANSSGAISLGAGGAYGTAGQILVSGGSGAAPTWTSSGTASANYGSFVRTTTQTNAGGASGNAVSYDTTSSANNFSIVSGSRITAAVAGTYQILASLQVQKTDGGTDDINFWIKKNGVNEPNSAYNLTLQGSGAAQLGYINWVVTLAAGEYVELWWYSADANARLLADPAVAPYPAVPASGFIIHPMGA